VGVVNSLWRALAVFRVGALAFAVLVTANTYSGHARPVLGWAVVATMAAWTVFCTWAYTSPRRRGWPLLVADLAVTAAALAASLPVIGPDLLSQGAPTLTVAWVAAPVLAFAVAKGIPHAAVAAVVLGTVDALVRGFATEVTLNGQVVLLLAGFVMGYLTRIAAVTEQRLQRATELEAGHRERERLARSIHDSVLQALTLIERRGAQLGGEAAELGRLAGEQGAVLRTLVEVGASEPPTAGEIDLRTLLRRHATPLVSVAVPATPVTLPTAVATEIEAAVAAALANVTAHAGTDGRAFVLVEDESDRVTVTVRDDGAGMASTRLDQAAAAGRLGVAQSIRGRIRDLSGTVTITSTPGAGTEVEMRVPRHPGLVREPA
jgi:signal transduction histidine kinase